MDFTSLYRIIYNLVEKGPVGLDEQPDVLRRHREIGHVVVARNLFEDCVEVWVGSQSDIEWEVRLRLLVTALINISCIR